MIPVRTHSNPGGGEGGGCVRKQEGVEELMLREAGGRELGDPSASWCTPECSDLCAQGDGLGLEM